ncbi:hypothetical protein FNZ56_04170 [Pseudoluteimonas lycopersici]|uniref:Uncharacterized protein n=1 Tax=Pseudoluteimonas lycopersici TaxID=1324796 RepID=A0A516V3M9_9GAMM|nr:hypothetical protein [Lysobacter lycopersici]QDQ73126.1 hypothetical protein FNZ56_04170 [Lysobacter lycopersici]
MQTLILLGAVLGPSLLLLGVLLGKRFWRLRDRRRSPIAHKVLNFPGEGLRRKMQILVKLTIRAAKHLAFQLVMDAPRRIAHIDWVDLSGRSLRSAS